VRITVLVRRSDRGDAIQAYCPDLPGCAAAASTEEEALRLLRRRLDDHFSTDRRRVPPGTRVHVLEV
jgi:predicted RNase H-like HicB family nuclease